MPFRIAALFSYTNYLLVFYTRGGAELVFVSDLPGCVDMKLILYQWRTNSVARTFGKLEGAVDVEVRRFLLWQGIAQHVASRGKEMT